jgi:hypothetical protein
VGTTNGDVEMLDGLGEEPETLIGELGGESSHSEERSAGDQTTATDVAEGTVVAAKR